MTNSATILIACIAIAIAAMANVLNTLLQCRDTISGRVRLGWLGVVTVVVSLLGAIAAAVASYVAWEDDRQSQVSTSEAYAALASKIAANDEKLSSTLALSGEAIAERLGKIENKMGIPRAALPTQPPPERTDNPIVQSTGWEGGRVTLKLSGPRGTRITDNFSTTPFRSSTVAVKVRVEIINVPEKEQGLFRAQFKSDKRLAQDGDRSAEFGAGAEVVVSSAGGADAGYYLVSRGNTGDLIRRFPNAAVRLTIVR